MYVCRFFNASDTTLPNMVCEFLRLLLYFFFLLLIIPILHLYIPNTVQVSHYIQSLRNGRNTAGLRGDMEERFSARERKWRKGYVLERKR